MTQSDKAKVDKIILLGGNSRAASSIREEIGAERCIGIVRSGRTPGDVVTTDYATVPDGLDLCDAWIVNCVGSPLGDGDALMRLNRDVPLAWAEAARATGAKGLVHISSFSVFGVADHVGRETPTRPTSAYGRSKLAAERALEKVSSPRFPIARLRVPILIGGGRDKLAQLVALAKKTGFVPSAYQPKPRSMLPYGGLARAVRLCIEGRIAGVCHAADPEPFDARLLQEEARTQGKRVRILRLPTPAVSLVRSLAPSIHASLLAPNLLEERDNLLAGETDYERLRDVVARLVAA